MNKFLILLFYVIPLIAFGQSSNPNDTLKIGNSTSSSDKGLIFDTGDGVSNKKLLIEDTSKLLKFDGNNFQLGDGALTEDKAIKFNGTSGKQIKYDYTNTEFNINDDLAISTGVLKLNGSTLKEDSGKLYFSENGGPDKRFGSGSGSGDGGVNLLLNNSFEDGALNWTNSGGTFTQEDYTDPSESNTKFARFVATTSGEYVESDLEAVPSFFGNGCMADIKFYTSDVNAFKISVLDSVDTEVGFQNLSYYTGQGLTEAPYISFPCVAGSTYKLRVEALAAGTIDFDQAYLGNYRNVSTSNCQGRVECEDTFSAKISSTDVVSSENLDFINGNCTDATLGKATCYFNPGIFTVAPNCTAVSNRSLLTGNRTADVVSFSDRVEIKILTANSTSSVGVDEDFSLNCQKAGVDFASAKPQTSVKSSNADWYIDANIGGANASIGSSIASYTEMTNAGLDLVINSGSASAEIPCSSTNPSTGLTCSVGNESLGIAFFPPEAADYEVCASFTNTIGLSTAGSINNAFQIVETPNNAQTILQEGGTRIATAISNTAANNTSNQFPVHVCGRFKIGDTSKKTFRVMYEVTSSGTVSNAIAIDRNASIGQRDMRITVRKLSKELQRPILLSDAITTPGKEKTVLVGAKVLDGAATTTISFQDDSFISGVCTNPGAGQYACTFNPGYWASEPYCWPVALSGTREVVAIPTGTTSVAVQFRISGTLTDTDFKLMCSGQKN